MSRARGHETEMDSCVICGDDCPKGRKTCSAKCSGALGADRRHELGGYARTRTARNARKPFLRRGRR